jgi:hypothetical protein
MSRPVLSICTACAGTEFFACANWQDNSVAQSALLTSKMRL